MSRYDKLFEKIEEWRPLAHVYGASDCFQFVADVVLAISGTDHRLAFPTYSSKEEAEAIIAPHGGYVGFIAHVLGPPKHPAHAMRGDVVVYRTEDGSDNIGICLGNHLATMAQQGLVFREMRLAVHAWGTPGG